MTILYKRDLLIIYGLNFHSSIIKYYFYFMRSHIVGSELTFKILKPRIKKERPITLLEFILLNKLIMPPYLLFLDQDGVLNCILSDLIQFIELQHPLLPCF